MGKPGTGCSALDLSRHTRMAGWDAGAVGRSGIFDICHGSRIASGHGWNWLSGRVPRGVAVPWLGASRFGLVGFCVLCVLCG